MRFLCFFFILLSLFLMIYDRQSCCCCCFAYTAHRIAEAPKQENYSKITYLTMLLLLLPDSAVISSSFLSLSHCTFFSLFAVHFTCHRMKWDKKNIFSGLKLQKKSFHFYPHVQLLKGKVDLIFFLCCLNRWILRRHVSEPIVVVVVAVEEKQKTRFSFGYCVEQLESFFNSAERKFLPIIKIFL